MSKNEVDVVTHLLQVESQAAALVNEAQIESNLKISQAKAKADEEFSEKLSSVVKNLEFDCQNKFKTFDDEHSKAFQDFKNQITQSQKDTLSFNSFMDKVLFK